MSEIMRPISFGNAVGWILDEYRSNNTVFGLHASKFYRGAGNGIQILGENLGSAIGPAAGPNSQLAQNIVVSWLAGSRFIELKTVQTMDGEELRSCIARPCINAQDEGYNVEWSTELTVGEAMNEYIKAWFLLHVFAKELKISEKPDFAFNMSVGYSLEGIQSPKINGYIEGLKDARSTEIWRECNEFLKNNIEKFENFTLSDLSNISPAITKSVTLSTLHGCPKEEIEHIAEYLITEKKLHTYVKCNPTLLGYSFVRELLDEMGYDYISFDAHHFENDLQFADAVEMFKRLMNLADKHEREFGVKLTNTFPVQIRNKELPGEEMYMSGRALYPLTLNLASIISDAFDGKLPISFSGGADYFNITDILKIGIRPVTVATTILKPGGYARLNQLACLSAQFTGSTIDCDALKQLAKNVSQNPRHRKAYRSVKSRKVDLKLAPYDCAIAPCGIGCPINQQIPQYLNLVNEQKYKEAYKVIIKDNALPSITAAICDHKCQTKCTRIDYDESIHIRSMKNIAVTIAADAVIEGITPSQFRTKKKTVIIGCGPAGIAVAIYLRRNGMDVTVLEKRERPYGIVSHVIPEFRIAKEAIARDLKLAENIGVNVRYNADPNYDISELKKAYDYIVLATGAWGKSSCELLSGEERLIDAIEFLKKAKKGEIPTVGNIAVIGGGDVAMDCARVAKRAGINVAVVYRRTKEYMPAGREELTLAEAEGVRFMELLSPSSYDGENLVCDVMKLTDYASDGRRGVVRTGKQRVVYFDAVVCATGATVDTSRFVRNGISLTNGFPVVDSNNESNIKNIFIAGDCKRGPATIVKAMADAKKIAMTILSREGLAHDFTEYQGQIEKACAYSRKGVLSDVLETYTEGSRCLACNTVCEICVDVCPNRANISLANGQILHVDGMCNECGNCEVFCPHMPGAPYKDKVTLFWTKEDFDSSENIGFLRLPDGYLVRHEDKSIAEYSAGDECISDELKNMIENTPAWV